MSDMTLTKVLRDTGLADRAAVHGFRSSFRDWAAEQTDASHAAMELSLAHTVGTAGRAGVCTQRFAGTEAEIDAAVGGVFSSRSDLSFPEWRGVFARDAPKLVRSQTSKRSRADSGCRSATAIGRRASLERLHKRI